MMSLPDRYSCGAFLSVEAATCSTNYKQHAYDVKKKYWPRRVNMQKK